MIDLHCHLDLYPNVMSFINLIEKRNVFTLVVTTSPRGWLATTRVFSHLQNIECALGLHPEVVTQKFTEIDLFFENLKKCRFIGEVGIDNSRNDKESLALQTSFFRNLIKKSSSVGGKIISIHSRKAESIVLDIIERENTNSIPILHWFTGTQSTLKRAIEADCFFSIGPAMLTSVKGKQLASKMPLNRILPESDGPFAQLNFKPVMPWEAMNIVPQLVDIFGLSHKTITEQLYRNFKELMMHADRIKAGIG